MATAPGTDQPQAPQANAQPADAAGTTDPEIVRNAAALGWALTELLSRCYTLQPLTDAEKAARKTRWNGASLFILPPIRSPRQQIVAQMLLIHSLATQLKVDALEIVGDQTVPPHTLYIAELEKDVAALCRDDCAAEQFPTLKGHINERIYYWDMNIYEALQNASPEPDAMYAYLNAYLVGRSIAALRWYSGPNNYSSPTDDQHVRDDILNEGSLERLCDHVQLMAPSPLSTFAAIAIANSLKPWGKAFLDKSINLNKDGDAIPELQYQATIWHDLLITARDPRTFVTPSSFTWRYTLRVALFVLPLILMGIAMAAVITVLLLFLVGLIWPLIVKTFTTDKTLLAIVTTIGTGFALIAGVGTTIPTVRTVWQWLIQKVQSNADQNAGAAVGSAQSSVFAMLWDEAQQEAINQATYVPVPSIGQI
jgi:hypothetical protein